MFLYKMYVIIIQDKNLRNKDELESKNELERWNKILSFFYKINCSNKTYFPFKTGKALFEIFLSHHSKYLKNHKYLKIILKQNL